MVPFVIEKIGNNERLWDMYSRLLRDRIIMLDEPIEDKTASMVCAQLLFLQSENSKAPIWIYINSPGGIVTNGLAIYDTMKHVNLPIGTLCMGQAASMAAVLLSSGTKGMRVSLPSSRIMIHQPSGGFKGQATEAVIQTEEIVRLRKILDGILSVNTGLSVSEISKITERDAYFDAYEAMDLGLIDKII